MSSFEEFLEKVKSLQIQTSKSAAAAGGLCPHCGKPFAAHKLLGAICSMVRRQKEQQTKTDEEQSFAI